MPCACLHLPQLSAEARDPHAHPAFWGFFFISPVCSLPSLLLLCLHLHPLNLHWMDPLTHEHTRELGRKHNMWRQVLLQAAKVRRRNIFFPLYLTRSGRAGVWGRRSGGGSMLKWSRAEMLRRFRCCARSQPAGWIVRNRRRRCNVFCLESTKIYFLHTVGKISAITHDSVWGGLWGRLCVLLRGSAIRAICQKKKGILQGKQAWFESTLCLLMKHW